jgi:LPS export ABC transporter protein LptC
VDLKVQERDRSWTVVGEEGDLYRGTNTLEVRRKVVLTSDDGLRLETTVLRWHGAERRLWTDVPVRIFRSRAVIDGTALDVRMEEEATAVKGRVRAVFEGARAGGGR